MKQPPTRIALMLGALALFVVPVAAVAAGGTFTDVADTSAFKADIDWLAATGVTKGCNPPANDKFCPEDNVTRQQMAAFLHRLATNKVVDAATAVNAVNATNADNAVNATNATNADNAVNATNADNATNATNADNADKLDGIDSNGFLPGGTPPIGTTARGNYALGNNSSYAWDSFDWGFEMPGRPTAHFLTRGSSPTADCPGTPADPQAAEGHLCVYEAQSAYVRSQAVMPASTGSPGNGDPFGASVVAFNTGSDDFWSYGTWAVTVGIDVAGTSPDRGPSAP